MLYFAREQVEEAVKREGCELRDLATTLITAAFVGSSVSIAHIGDGAVVAKTGRGLLLASTPEESEYANEVMPLTSNMWNEHLYVRSIEDVSLLAIFTDGCQKAALKKSPQGYEPFDGFFVPIFSYAKEIEDIKNVNGEIEYDMS